MSVDNVGRFIDTLSTDSALQQKLGAVRDCAELARLAVQAGSERGMRFTEKEFLTSIGQQAASGEAELSDDDLKGVAGGTVIRSSLTPNQRAILKLIEQLAPSKPPG